MGVARFRARFSSANTGTSRRYECKVAFRGVDLTSPRFQVSQDRAIDALNYVWDKGCLRKRHGLKEPFGKAPLIWYSPVNEWAGDGSHISTDEEYTGTSGAYRTNAEDSSVHDLWSLGDVLIIHKGRVLFWIKNGYHTFVWKPKPISAKNTSLINSSTAYYLYEVPDEKLSAFVGGGKLWLLTGNKFYVLERTKTGVKMSVVANSDMCYAPTTTIGIVQSGSSIGDTRQTYESANLLSEWRINGLVGGIKNADENTKGYTYTLDSPIIAHDESDYSKLRITITTLGKVNR